LGRTRIPGTGRDVPGAPRRAGLALSRRRHGWSAATVTDYGLDLAVIGNGRTAALVNPSSRIVWWCFPRFDSDPVFSRLLGGDEEKCFPEVLREDCPDFRSDYLRNPAIVAPTMMDRKGGAIRVTVFAPRSSQLGRPSRPPQLVRIIEPIA